MAEAGSQGIQGQEGEDLRSQRMEDVQLGRRQGRAKSQVKRFWTSKGEMERVEEMVAES